MSLTGQPVWQKPPKISASDKRAGIDHMGNVKQCPCVICGRCGPSDAHHCRSQSFGGKRARGLDTIPLCKLCHTVGPMAFHVDKKGWERRNGFDFDYLGVVADMLAGELS